MPQSSILMHPFRMFPLFQKCCNPRLEATNGVKNVVHHPCPSRIVSRLTLTFIRHPTLINGNLIKQKKISFLFWIKFQQFHIFSAYSKFECIITCLSICTFFIVIVLNIFVCSYCCKLFAIFFFTYFLKWFIVYLVFYPVLMLHV